MVLADGVPAVQPWASTEARTSRFYPRAPVWHKRREHYDDVRFLRINAQPFAAVALRKRADQQPFAFERYAANRYGQQVEEPKTKQASQPITLPEGMMNGYRLAGIRDVRQMLTLSAAEISPKLAIEYHAAGIHSASEMLKLYRPWGISKKRVLPAYVRVFKDNGIHDVEQMHQIRKQLSMGPDYQPTYWPSGDREEDLAHLQFVIAGRARRDAATSIRYLREEFTRLSPKFEEARERRQGTDEEEQINKHIEILHNVLSLSNNEIALFGDAVLWARTLDLQAYSNIPETEAHEISLWCARLIDTYDINTVRRMPKQAMSPQAVAKLRAQHPVSASLDRIRQGSAFGTARSR